MMLRLCGCRRETADQARRGTIRVDDLPRPGTEKCHRRMVIGEIRTVPVEIAGKAARSSGGVYPV